MYEGIMLDTGPSEEGLLSVGHDKSKGQAGVLVAVADGSEGSLQSFAKT
jgi:hypothetical protein